MCVQPGDRLIWVDKCTESDSLLLANSEGKAIRFCADDSQVTKRPPCSFRKSFSTVDPYMSCAMLLMLLSASILRSSHWAE